MSEYRVQLPVFSGPMDLLLHLARERELPVAELPLAAIADQFMEYMKTLQAVDLDHGGEFLLVASTLMEIKSRELLPEPTPEEAEELQELRTDLIGKLLEYRRFREAAQTLAERFEAQSLLFGREVARPEPSPEDLARVDPGSMEVWDLVKAFTRILRETQKDRPLGVHYEELPVAVHMERLVERLEGAGPEGVSFRELGKDASDRLYWIGLFLALLELVRLAKISVRQSEGDILILRHEPVGGGTEE